MDDGTPRKLVLTGFLVNATNPKGIIFMLAVLPQFIDPAKPQFVQYAICGATLFFTDLVVMSGYTGFAARVLRLLREPHHVRWMNRSFGGLFVAAGAVLATFPAEEARELPGEGPRIARGGSMVRRIAVGGADAGGARRAGRLRAPDPTAAGREVLAPLTWPEPR